jgi:hypothetical protein
METKKPRLGFLLCGFSPPRPRPPSSLRLLLLPPSSGCSHGTAFDSHPPTQLPSTRLSSTRLPANHRHRCNHRPPPTPWPDPARPSSPPPALCRFEWNGRRCSVTDEVLRQLLRELQAIVPDFNAYHTFLSNKERSDSLVARWREREPFRGLWMGLMQKTRGLGPESLLVMPVQRLPRYKLLLEAIQKAMPRYHPGRQMLQEVS